MYHGERLVAGAGTAPRGGGEWWFVARRPLIGVCPQLRCDDGRVEVVGENRGVTDALLAAGALPLILPLTADDATLDEAVALVDGLVLPGGHDVDPARYGATRRETDMVCEELDAMELPLTRKALAADLPLLAICRGCQALNVALGGTLWQEADESPLPTGVSGHWQHFATTACLVHDVVVEPGSALERCMGPGTVQANSHHHQCVRDLGEGLVVTGRATDGVVEAVELPSARFCLGVQWHPETIFSHPEQLALFEGLVHAATGVGRRA